MALPKSVDIFLGFSNKGYYENEFGGISANANTNSYVNTIGKRLSTVSDDPSFPFSFKVLNSKDINAFALPGGPVYIHQGLIDTLSNDDEIAGVLAHEVGHITGRHGIEGLERGLGSGILLSAIDGYLNKNKGKSLSSNQIDSINKMTTGISGLVQLGYSRDNEYEADAKAVKYTKKAGFNPMGLIDVMQKFRDMEGRDPTKFEVFFSTHPSSKARLDEIRKLIGDNYPVETAKKPTTTMPTVPFYEKEGFRKVVSILPFVSLGIIAYLLLKPKFKRSLL